MVEEFLFNNEKPGVFVAVCTARLLCAFSIGFTILSLKSIRGYSVVGGYVSLLGKHRIVFWPDRRIPDIRFFEKYNIRPDSTYRTSSRNIRPDGQKIEGHYILIPSKDVLW